MTFVKRDNVSEHEANNRMNPLRRILEELKRPCRYLPATKAEINEIKVEIKAEINEIKVELEQSRAVNQGLLHIVERALALVDSLGKTTQGLLPRESDNEQRSVEDAALRSWKDMSLAIVVGLEQILSSAPKICRVVIESLLTQMPLILNSGIIDRLPLLGQVAALKSFFHDSRCMHRYALVDLLIKRTAIARVLDQSGPLAWDAAALTERIRSFNEEVEDKNIPGTRQGHAEREIRCELFWGDWMTVVEQDEVGKYLNRDGFFEPGLSQFILLNLDRDAVFFDVGAHFGYYSLLAAHLLNSPDQIHAFEPTGVTFQVLQQNCQRIGVSCFNNVAVWSESCEISFTEFGDKYAAWNTSLEPRLSDSASAFVTPKKRRVLATSLDDYCAQMRIVPDFIKVDAESAESKIIEGMRDILIRARPIVTLEVGDCQVPEAPLSRQLVEAMVGFGYDVFECPDGQIRPHKMLDMYEYDNLFFLPKTLRRKRMT